MGRYKGCFDACLFTGRQESVTEIEAIFWEGDEEPSRVFNAMGGNVSQDLVFRDAFSSRLRIGNGIPPSAVEKTVVSSRGTRGKISLLNQEGGDAP
jgi:hypothetical protein